MNKLIILLNLSGSYKGGAQRRYINLFKHLQKTRDDYFLLLNKSLYDSCKRDGIIESDKNIIVIKVWFDSRNVNTIKARKVTQVVNRSKHKIANPLRNKLGAIKYFIKLAVSYVNYNFKFYLLIKKYNIKVLYGVFTGGIWSWQLARILKLKLVYSYNDSNISMVSKSYINFLSSEYWPLKYSSKVDFLSQMIVNDLIKKNIQIPENRILITPNSFIDYTRFKPEFPKKDLITFNSRLVLGKNPDLFLDSLIYLSKIDPISYKVAIIGEGKLLDDLKIKAENNNLNFVRFYGGMSKPEDIIAKSKIFISLQTENNYPSQSLLEAMACENAIIASDVGETRKLVSDKEGVLISLDSSELAIAIQYLTRNTDVCALKGKNSREKVLSEHTIDKYCNYFIEITSG